MFMLEKLSIIGLKILKIITAIIVVVVVGVSLYNILDMWSIQHDAFVSRDLLQYRPNVENGEPVTFEEIRRENKDVGGWLTLYNTPVDYPTVKGKDDMEYVNKNALGRTTPTGSIYLSYKNKKDFSDNYNVMYGHNVSNGSMFGCILKYFEKGYFDKHQTGILITPNQVYDVKVISILDTDAYDKMVYTVGGDRDLDSILDYFRENGEHFREPKGVKKLLVLSTCYSEGTNGRAVLLVELSEHEGEYHVYDDPGTPLAGWTHDADYWAFLNLLCMLATIYLVLPIHILSSKFRRFKNNIGETDVNDSEGSDNEDINKNETNINTDNVGTTFQDANEDEDDDVEKEDWYKSRKTKMIIGIIIELILGIVSVIAFILTENIFKPIQMIDEWTPLMLIILIATYLIDRFLMRRPKNKDNNDEDNPEDENRLDEESDGISTVSN